MLHVALLALAACLQEPPRITATLKDLPAENGRPPAFLAEGTTDLVDGTRLEVFFYVGPVQYGFETLRDATTVKEGKFSKEIAWFRGSPKNLAGQYGLRIAYKPLLQPRSEYSRRKESHADAVLQIGTPRDFVRDQNAVKERLAADVKKLLAFGQEITAQAEKDQGKPDRAVWEALSVSLRKRCLDIEREAIQDREYMIHGFREITDSGLEGMRRTLVGIAECAAANDLATMKEGLVRLDGMAQGYLRALSTRPEDPKTQAADLLGQARQVLRGALPYPGLRAAEERKRFVQLTFKISPILDPEQQLTLRSISGAAADYLDALTERKPEAAELHEKVDRRIAEFLQALKEEK
jgi:hypothetical protein